MRSDARNKPKPRFRLWIVMILFAILILTATIFYYDSNTRLVTNEYELLYPNLPEAFDGYRIAVLSDIHGAEFGRNNEQLVKKVSDAHPDIIAITGDLIDRYNTPPIERQLEIADMLISDLVNIAPVYFITGNHDWDSGELHRIEGMLNGHGATVLRNQYTLLEKGSQSVILAGTDDPNGPADMITPDVFIDQIRESQGDGFLVVLEHRNGNLPLYSELGVDLLICGHAHGGIIRLPFTDGLIGPKRKLFPTHTSGVYSMLETNMVVSRGLGSPLGWMRLFNNPHIPVVILRVDR